MLDKSIQVKGLLIQFEKKKIVIVILISMTLWQKKLEPSKLDMVGNRLPFMHSFFFNQIGIGL